MKNSIVFGVGINDADYQVYPSINGVKKICPFYLKWKSMIQRCYSKKYQERQPTYIGCSVCDEWLIFSNFKEWMKGKDWYGKHLDKDIMQQGNKIYSPELCVFVTRRVNALLNENKGQRGSGMLGVNIEDGRFRVRCSDGKDTVHVGLYSTELEGHNAYREFKYKLIARVAESQPKEVKEALLRYKIPMY